MLGLLLDRNLVLLPGERLVVVVVVAETAVLMVKRVARGIPRRVAFLNQLFHLGLHHLHLHVHPLHLAVVVLPQALYLRLQVLDLLVLLLLALDEDDRVVEVFVDQVLPVVLPQDLNLAA